MQKSCQLEKRNKNNALAPHNCHAKNALVLVKKIAETLRVREKFAFTRYV
jgi:hypothetical protein